MLPTVLSWIPTQETSVNLHSSQLFKRRGQMHTGYPQEALATNQRSYKIIVDYKVGSDRKIFGSRSGLTWTYGLRALRTIAKYFPVWHAQSISSILLTRLVWCHVSYK